MGVWGLRGLGLAVAELKLHNLGDDRTLKGFVFHNTLIGIIVVEGI